jgi:hypothetical protein
LPRCCHPPPTSDNFSDEKKEEKIDPATGGGRDPLQWPGGERFGHPSGNFCLSGEKKKKEKKKKKKKKKDRSGQ